MHPEPYLGYRFSCETFLPCDPRRWMHRFMLLFLMCMLSFGSYYVYDNPAALERTILNVSAIQSNTEHVTDL